MAEPRKLILVVEDDHDISTIIQTRLKSAGYDVVTARDGDAALGRLQYTQPHAVLLDLTMPKLDGFGVLRWMSEQPAVSDIPVLVLTARRNEADVKRAIAGGASDFLVKPFSPDVLLSRLARLLRRAPGVDPKAEHFV